MKMILVLDRKFLSDENGIGGRYVCDVKYNVIAIVPAIATAEHIGEDFFEARYVEIECEQIIGRHGRTTISDDIEEAAVSRAGAKTAILAQANKQIDRLRVPSDEAVEK